MEALVSEVHLAKALLLIDVVKLGMAIFVSYVHLAKVLLPIGVREIGMTILVSWTHPSNAELPNETTLGWMECGGKIHEEEINQV